MKNREFSCTSQEGVVVKGFIKEGGDTFFYIFGDLALTFNFATNEILRNGTADLSDAAIKANGK